MSDEDPIEDVQPEGTADVTDARSATGARRRAAALRQVRAGSDDDRERLARSVVPEGRSARPTLSTVKTTEAG